MEVIYLPAAIHCPNLTDLRHAKPLTFDTVFNATITLQCDKGYTFENGTQVNISCTASKTWSDQPQSCEGEIY